MGYLDGLEMVLLVIMRPNSAFEIIRDNNEKYFWWSVGGFILSSIGYGLLVLFLPEPQDMESPPQIFPDDFVMSTILYELIFITVIWLISKAKGSTASWKQVSSVLFYISITISIPVLILFAALLVFGSDINNEDSALPLFASTIAVSVGAGIWALILTIKAIKVVNEWIHNTLRAVMVFLLGFITSFLALVPMGLVTAFV